MSKEVSFNEYEKAVREARQFIQKYDKVRFKIADIAMRVCDTSKGGRKKSSVFSITKFADAIELNNKTLCEWIRVKRLVIDKLPATELKDKSKYRYEDLRETVLKINEKSSKKEVLNQWRLQLAIPLENRAFIRYDKHLRSILFNAQRPARLIMVEKVYIEDIIKKCDLIASLLKKEIEFREKFSKENRIMKKKTKETEAIREVAGLKNVR